MTPGRSDCAALLLAAQRMFLNWPPEEPKNWGRIYPNRNDYHTDTIEIGSIFWFPNITDWWHQQDEIHSKYADLSDVACDIISMIQQDVAVEAGCSVWGDVIGWRLLKTIREKLRKKVVLRQYADANDRIWQVIMQYWIWPKLKWHRSEERWRGKDIARNGQCAWLFGYVARQPEPLCYQEGITRSNQADDSRLIRFGYWRHC